jgi:dipeptidyl aminopeptidase/acylaminoacyl peptidase
MFKKMLITTVSLCTLLSANSLEELFAQPTDAEKDSVIARWEARDVGVYNWTVEESATLQGYDVDVVSHTVNDLKHYALVRYPLNYSPDGDYQLIIANHGAMNGVDANILMGYSKSQYENNIVLAPSFQGEELRCSALGFGTYTSEGEKSEFDYDIDDVLALINGVVENVDGASEENMLIFGGSRGGCVTYLVSIREPRIRKAVVNYGGTDHLTFPGIEEIVDPMINQYVNNGPFISSIYNVASLYMKDSIDSISLKEARFNLLSKSPIHFIDLFPDYLQVHHGDEDTQVSVENSRTLDSALTASPLAGTFEYIEYPGGGHGPNMDGSSQRKDEFFAKAMEDLPEEPKEEEPKEEEPNEEEPTEEEPEDDTPISQIVNPAKSGLTIQSFNGSLTINGINEVSEISIFSSNGRRVYSGETINGVVNQTFPVGIYLVKIRNSEIGSLVKKITVQ